MKEFSACLDLDQVSKLLQDPVVLASLLLRRGGATLVKSGEVRNLLRLLRDFSKERAQSGELVYARLSGDDWCFRIVVYQDVLSGIIYERGGSALLGFEAYSALSNVVSGSARLVATAISLESVHPQLRDSVEKCLSRRVSYPQAWLNKEVYRIRIEDVISVEGGYSYVLAARDSMGRRYALKVLKMSGGEELDLVRAARTLRGYLESLEVISTSIDELSTALENLGFDASIARELHPYRRYIATPRALLVMADVYDEGYYAEYPPAVLEDYADMGDLEEAVSRGIDERLALHVGIRVCGALALSHAVGVVHGDVKPRNVLLVSDSSEPLGLRPALSDFAGLGRPSAGLRILRATPAYADPVSLSIGRASPSYDVYSLSMTLLYSLTRETPRPFIVASAALLRAMYGVPIDLTKLVSGSRDLEKLAVECVRSVTIPRVEERRDTVINALRPFHSEVAERLRKSFGRIGEVIARGLEPDLGRRYRNCVEMWLDLKRAFEESGFGDLVPGKGR